MRFNQFITLSFSILAGLSGGTIYSGSLFFPMIASKLNLDSVSINQIGLSSIIGITVASALIGNFIDEYGSQLIFLIGSIFISTGYTLMQIIYLGDDTFDQVGITGLIFCQLLIGCGSSCAIYGAVSATAKAFDSKSRGFMMSIVTASFGLSAALVGTISRTSFLSPGSPESDATSNLLQFLSFSTGIILLAASIFVRPIPISHKETPVEIATEFIKVEGEKTETTELISIRKVPSGLELFKDARFLLIFFTSMILSGTGLLWINNLGLIVKTISPSNTNATVISEAQVRLVTLLSISNASARIVAGFSGSLFSSPGWILNIVSILLFISQLIASQTSNVTWLTLPTILIGAGYGALFGTTPILLLENFGINHFGRNAGLLGIATAIGSFSNEVFGIIYDSNVLRTSQKNGLDSGETICQLGLRCYSSIFYFTCSGCIVAFALTLILNLKYLNKKA